MFGFLNIYKPNGLTSHDVVARLRRVTKVKQIGHTGTLDPFAEGVLPICVGKATRLIEFLADDKAYFATVQLGVATSTYDIEGETTFTSDKKVSSSDVENTLKYFEGEIEQLPPIYSAIKVNGKKLYDYARQGQTVEIKPRKVVIEKIELKNFDPITQTAEIYVKCSKGTYIRSIAHELGQKLGVGGHLIKLIRTQAGRFLLENAIPLEKVQNEFSSDMLINPIDMIDLPKVEVTEQDLEKIKHGQFLKNDKFNTGQFVILIYNKDVICAVGCADSDKILIKKVFIS